MKSVNSLASLREDLMISHCQILLLMALFVPTFSYANICIRALDQAAWADSNFTKPTEHSDERFLYIVHAGPNVINKGDVVTAFIHKIKEHNFNKDGFFSSSLVSENHTGTFSLSGVILDVPSDKIIAATSEDMRSTEAHKLTLEEGMKRFNSLPPPAQILNHASKDTGFYNSDMSWSEVLIYGKQTSLKSIRVTGFFTHKDTLGEPILSVERVSALTAAAKDFGVPMVFLPPPKGNFVLKVRMKGERKPMGGGLLTDYGPQSISFFASESAVRSIFAEAKAKKIKVRLVDETGGPVSGLVDDSLFEGQWFDRWNKSIPVEVPPGTEHIELNFLK